MKRLIFTSFMLILAASMAQAYVQNYSYTTLSSIASVEVIASRYDPYPVEPGEKFRLYLTLKNIGPDIATDATCRVIDNYPFYAYNYKEKSIGSLIGGGEFLIYFDLAVDNNALESTENLEIQCTANPSTGFWLVRQVPISIQYRYAILNIVNVNTIPETLQIGKQGSIKFTLANNAETTIKDVLLQLDFSGGKLAPSDGATVKKVRNLNLNEGTDVSFNVYTLPDTEPGFYTIPLDVSYSNNQGTNQNFSTLITVKVSEEPRFYVLVDSIGPETYNGGEKIVLKFVNDGKADLKFFNVKILDGRDLTVKADNQIYIGDLDSDDDITEIFYGKLKRTKATIPLEISYRDSINNEYKEQINVSVDQNKVLISRQADYSGIIFVLIAGGLAFYYFYWKKRKK